MDDRFFGSLKTRSVALQTGPSRRDGYGLLVRRGDDAMTDGQFLPLNLTAS